MDASQLSQPRVYRPPRAPLRHLSSNEASTPLNAALPRLKMYECDTPNSRMSSYNVGGFDRPTRPLHSRSQSINDLRHIPATPISYASGVMTPIGGPRPVDERTARLRALGDVSLECIDCGPFVGRAGSILFFLLAFNVRHRLNPQSAKSDLRRRKEVLRNKKSGLVVPQWPVCYHRDFAMIEPNAILRYLASQLGLYGQEARKDHQADMLLDKLACWRDHLSSAIGESSDSFEKNDVNAPTFQEYLKGVRHQFLTLFETFLEAADSPFFLGDQVSWVDPPIMSVLYEDLTTAWQATQQSDSCSKVTTANSTGDVEPSEEASSVHLALLESFPKCLAFMDSMRNACPLLARWITEHKFVWFPKEALEPAEVKAAESTLYASDTRPSIPLPAHSRQGSRYQDPYGGVPLQMPTPTGYPTNVYSIPFNGYPIPQAPTPVNGGLPTPMGKAAKIYAQTSFWTAPSPQNRYAQSADKISHGSSLWDAD